jgi:hypothetical protein
MLPAFLLGAAVLFGLWMLVRGFLAADPRMLARVLRYGAFGLGGIVFVFLAATGRIGIALAAVSFLLPFLVRWRDLLNRTRAARGPTAGQSSAIETRFLRMRLDHDTGALAGTVLEGPDAGRDLDDLPLESLMRLLARCRAEDPQSAAVLEAWLDRSAWTDWRTARQADDGARESPRETSSGVMTRQEALAILGLEEGAGPKEIKEAHRRLMVRLHPDQGGSTWLAAKINQARDLLLGV